MKSRVATGENEAIGRRSARVDDKVERIRRAAYHCFSKHGYTGTTVDLICAEAKISKGAFYWHFESKQGLFLEILNRWADEVEEQLKAQFAQALSGSDRIAGIDKALQREAHRGRAIMSVWFEFLSQVGRNDEMRAAIARFHQRIRDVIVTLLEPSMRRFDKQTIRAFASTVLATFIGLVGQDLADHEEANFETTSSAALGLLQQIVSEGENLNLSPVRKGKP